MKSVDAVWHISLDCDCPKCKKMVDLLEDYEFFDGNNIAIGEHETPATTGMEVVCPKCGHEFTVTCLF